MIPRREVLIDFLRYYTTPDGKVSTRIESFASDLLEFLENQEAEQS